MRLIPRARYPAGPHAPPSRPSALRAAALGLAALVLVAACVRYPEPERLLLARGIDPPAGDRFTICHGYDCTFRTAVSFTAEDWKAVTAPLEIPAPDAAAERTQIGLAIAQFETIVGARTGTSGDKGRLRFSTAGDATQLDCIDETTNTTTYLMLLQARGKLRWHRTGRPAKRGAFIDGRWYHETAVLVDIVNGAEFAIDAWFEDNGFPPHIMPLDDWTLSWDYS